MPQLVEVREPGLPPRQVVIDGVVEAGRDAAGILLSDPETSRRHAALTSVEDFLTVRDLGSTNGTTVNGASIQAETLLNPGDVVALGDVRIIAVGPLGDGPNDGGPEPGVPATGVARVPGAAGAATPAVPGQQPPEIRPAAGPGVAGSPTPEVRPAVGSAQVAVSPRGQAAVPPAPAVPVAGRAAVAPPALPARPALPAAPARPGGPPAAYAQAPVPAREGAPYRTGQPMAPLRPALEELVAKETDAAVLRYRKGSAGEAAASSYATAVRRARKRLAGLGSEPWGVKPQICLIDPFPDPDDPTMVLTSGTVVDAARGEIWVVVTAESPPEPPERPLALFFGASLPAGRDVELLIEGYGLHLCGVPSADAYLAEIDEEGGLPPLIRADGELRTLMALSFVRYLLERSGEADLLRLFATARAGAVDVTVQEIYGVGQAALEEQWLRGLETEDEPVRITAFIRLAATYLRPYYKREIELFIYLLMQLAFAPVFTFSFASLINGLASRTITFDGILRIVGLLAGVFAISLVAEVRGAYVGASVSSAIIRSLRTEMFSGLQSLSARWYGGRKQGDILSRLLSDVGQLEQGLTRTIRDGLFQSLSLLVSAFTLLKLSPLLGGVTLIGVPVVAFIYRRMDGPVLKRSKAVQEQTGALVSIAAESYQAHNVVQAFGLEDEERSRFRRAADQLYKRQLSLQLFDGLFGFSVDAIVTTLRLAVLLLGGYLVVNGDLKLGTFAASITLISQVVGPVSALTSIGQLVQVSTGALFRVREVLDVKPDIDDHPQATPIPPVRREIRVADVWFSYDSDRPTLRGVDVTIKYGTKVAFVGPTGAGKSSMLQLMMRFYDPDRGGILFDGRDIRGATLASLRGQLGVVFQDTFLFDGTLRDNIALGRLGASTADIEKAARAAQLHEYITTLPRGYDTPVGERGVRLSGGQRQRLALARALLRDPAVLLLDEATSALDPRTERLVAETLDKVSAGRTLIAVTHRLTSVVNYDQIYVLESGQIVENGRHDELLALGGVYADLWAEQNGLPRPAEQPSSDTVDPARALAQVPFFAGLDAAGLAAAVEVLREVRLERGDILPARSGRLAIVARGHGQVFAPDPAGRLVPVAKLGPGQVFGLGALLGDETAAQLHADSRLEIWILTEQALSHLAAQLPQVAAALGARRSSTAPLGGDRLSQVRLLPPELRR